MKKHKRKIISALIIIAALTAAWVFGGNYPGSGGTGAAPSGAYGAGGGTGARTGKEADTGQLGAASPVSDAAKKQPETEIASDTSSPAMGGLSLEVSSSTAASMEALQKEGLEPANSTPAPSQPLASETASGDGKPVATTGKYLTEPAPEGKPLPVEPDEAEIGDGSFDVSLTVRVDTILNNMGLLDREKHELVPDDGVIFPLSNVTAYEGESVFNVLQREMRRNKVHMVSRFTPIYNSAYIEAINNLYEFDAGELSGWAYKVNGWFPNYGSSRYLLQPGDQIELHYTCELGRDLSEYWLSGWQLDD